MGVLCTNHVLRYPIVGVYSITNTKNGKKYYGSSVDCDGRWRSHKSQLNGNKHQNPHLQRAWNKYGSNAFVFEIVEITDRENLLTLEQKYLNESHKNKESHYNIALDATSANLGRKFHPHTEKWKEEMSKRMRGKNHPRYGKLNSREANLKNSTSHKGNVPGNTDKAIYTFVNNMTGEAFQGTRRAFCKINKVDPRRAFDLVHAKRKIKEWSIILNAA